MANTPLRYFLYADDDLDDHLLFREIVEQIDPGIAVISCNHGLELLEFLEKLEPGEALPCCIVLDINMPRLDGLQTLELLKKDASLGAIAIVMFTTSDSPKEADRSRLLSATSFLTKPVSKKDFETLTQKFEILCSDNPPRKS